MGVLFRRVGQQGKLAMGWPGPGRTWATGADPSSKTVVKADSAPPSGPGRRHRPSRSSTAVAVLGAAAPGWRRAGVAAAESPKPVAQQFEPSLRAGHRGVGGAALEGTRLR